MKNLLAMLLLLAAAVRAEEKIICDFENDADKAIFDTKTGTLSDQHVTHGQKSLKILPSEYMSSWRMPKDWSGFDSLDIDAFVDGDSPVNGTILVGDVAWKEKGSTYWNRHNGTFNLKPGANVISIPVNGLFRGEAGSRGNDLHTSIDPKQILRLDIGFGEANAGFKAIYLDYVRLVKENRPDGIQAYSFGPESHTLFPGFTSVTWNTVYGKNGSKAGFKRDCGAPNRARDDTFPTRLYQNFVWFQENGNEFICDVPNGKVHGWLVFDDCGYWGGEEAKFHKRTVSANDKIVFTDDRGEMGPADYLLRFEKIEPKPGDSIWDLYMKDLFKPVRFEADVADGKLRIHCEADAAWSSKVASIIVFPDSIKTEGEKWVAEVEARNKKEFETRAVFMGPKPKTLDVPADAKAGGYWLGFPTTEETITFVDAPGKANGKFQRTAAKGQRLGFTFAVRPLKDFSSAVTLTATDLKGPGGTIPANALDLRYVHHQAQRGFNDIAYTIAPMSLRNLDGSLKLTKDLTRQFWITASVPADVKSGAYSGEVTLSAGELNIKLPLSIEVLDLTLDEPEFAFGFFGAWVPEELGAARKKGDWAALLGLMKSIGMTSIDGGPMINFSGLDDAGKPKLDFAACDEFYKMVKQAGFTKPLYRYGGILTGLYDGYSIGDTGHAWEKKTGKPMKDLLKIVWTAIQEHADKEGWPVLYIGMLDEPRAVEPAKENLEFHKAYREGAPFVKVGGFYSVNWKDSDPLDTTIQEIFKTMYWSGLNSHNQTDLDKGKEFGREVHIYNQGLDRYSFGEYQWAEMRKGVKGRMQWYTLALQGYQFFDLDAREPDPGILNWGRNGIIPTLHCERCCEGANDFKFAVTLWNLAQKKKDSPDAKAALDFLEEINQKIPAGKNERPAGLMDDESFREQCIKHLKALSK